MIIYQIIELTPDTLEEDGELIHYDAERVVLTFDDKENAVKVLNCIESVNIGFDTYIIKETEV